MPALGFDLVVLAAARRMREVGHPVVHAVTAVVAEFHSDRTVPGLAYLSRLADSRLPALPHLASCYASTPIERFMRISSATSRVGIVVTHPLLFRF